MMFSVLGSFFMSEKRVRKTWSEKTYVCATKY